MPTLDENKDMWERSYDWSRADHEWSSRWGSPEQQWHSAILPRVHSLLPARTVLEIGPGFGRWTQFLVGKCETLILVDLSERCIEACRRRFADFSHVSYHVNDGRSLDFIADESVDFAFSFDSLVHAEAGVIGSYLAQLARKLSPEGVGFMHHSNLGEHARYLALLRRLPHWPKRFLARLGLIETLEAQWRDAGMTAAEFERSAEQAGLRCVAQEIINWESTRLIDCISVVAREGSRRARANRIVRNPNFMREGRDAAKLARLYSPAS